MEQYFKNDEVIFSFSMDRLIDKIITFGKIHELRNKCIHKVSLFGDFGLEARSDYSSWKMLVGQSTMFAIAT